MHSYKNTSEGGNPPRHIPIGENPAKVPPPGASNSYEKVFKKLCAEDDKSLRNKPYSKAKMSNK